MAGSTGTSPGLVSSSATGLWLTALLAAADLDAREPEPALRVEAVYTGELWQNLRGGLDRGGAYLDNVDLTAELDADALWGWPGTRFYAHALYNNGNRLSSSRTGDLQAVSNIESSANDLRLYEAWMDVTLGDGSLRFGLYDLNSEFDALESSQLFLHSAHGIGTDIGQTGRNGPSIFPLTSLALRYAHAWDEGWQLRAALLDAVPGDPDDPEQAAVHVDSDEGALLVAELERDLGRGRLLVGAWSYTGRFDYWPDDADAPAVGRGNRGAYVRAEWRPSDTVAVFGRYGTAAGRFNPTSDFFGAGVTWQGPLPGRAQDTAGLALAWAEASSRHRTAPGDFTPVEREVALELTYRARIGERLVLQPDLQLVLDPAFDPDLGDVLALGLRVELELD